MNNERISPYYRHYLRATMFTIKKGFSDKDKAIKELELAISYKDDKRIRMVQYNAGHTFQDFDLMYEAANVLVRLDEPEGYAALGILYSTNNERNKYFNLHNAITAFSEGADLNNPTSLYRLANCYKQGIGTVIDIDKAASLFERAAATKNQTIKANSNYELGNYYFSKQEYKISLSYYKKAMKYGSQEAPTAISVFYLNGYGVKKDLDKYMDYLTMKFTPQSNLYIGGLYLLDQLTEQDEDLIEFHIHRAALQGSPIGALVYALALSTDQHPNEQEIRKWIEFAFKNGQNDDYVKSCYDEIENIFGKPFRDQIKMLADKYWNIKEALA